MRKLTFDTREHGYTVPPLHARRLSVSLPLHPSPFNSSSLNVVAISTTC